jgi:hypothetical protein
MLSALAIRNELAAMQDRCHELNTALRGVVVDADNIEWRARMSERLNQATELLNRTVIGIEVGFHLPDKEERKANG